MELVIRGKNAVKVCFLYMYMLLAAVCFIYISQFIGGILMYMYEVLSHIHMALC